MEENDILWGCFHLEGNVVVFGINHGFLGHAFWVLWLQQMYPNPIAEEPGKNKRNHQNDYHFLGSFWWWVLSGVVDFLPCTIKIKRSRPPDGEEPKNILIEIQRFLNWTANKRDVVQRSKSQRSSCFLEHLCHYLRSTNRHAEIQGLLGDENERWRGIHGSMERTVRGRLHFIADGVPATHATCPVHVAFTYLFNPLLTRIWSWPQVGE